MRYLYMANKTVYWCMLTPCVEFWQLCVMLWLTRLCQRRSRDEYKLDNARCRANMEYIDYYTWFLCRLFTKFGTTIIPYDNKFWRKIKFGESLPNRKYKFIIISIYVAFLPLRRLLFGAPFPLCIKSEHAAQIFPARNVSSQLRSHIS